MMKVKFANGIVKSCAAPTEQKVFKSGMGAGWILILKIVGEITSTELDSVITAENIASLDFLPETDNGEDKTLFTLSGYEKVTSSTIRHAEDITTTYAEIQLTKGI